MLSCFFIQYSVPQCVVCIASGANFRFVCVGAIFLPFLAFVCKPLVRLCVRDIFFAFFYPSVSSLTNRAIAEANQWD